MKQAVCLLLQNQFNEHSLDLSHPLLLKNKFLSVSRKNSDTKWSFPGGKVDSGESNIAAIMRETTQEVGLTLKANQLTAICNLGLET